MSSAANITSPGFAAVPGAAAEDLPADLVVVAIGQNRATQVAQAFPGVEVDRKGRVIGSSRAVRRQNTSGNAPAPTY